MRFFRKNDDIDLNEVIRDTLNRTSNMDKASAEFDEHIARIEKLYKLKNTNRSWSRPSADAILAAAASIAGIVLVANAENVGIITSKGFSLIAKPKN